MCPFSIYRLLNTSNDWQRVLLFRVLHLYFHQSETIYELDNIKIDENKNVLLDWEHKHARANGTRSRNASEKTHTTTAIQSNHNA